MQIAIFEPESLLADLIAFRLELLGHEVECWDNVESGVKNITQQHVDLLIIDVCQKDAYVGWDVIQGLRAKFSSAELPILVLSTDTDLSLVEQAVQAGADDYLIVPFDPVTLQEKTDGLLLRAGS